MGEKKHILYKDFLNFFFKEASSAQAVKGLHLQKQCQDSLSVLCGEKQGVDWSS